MINQLTQPQILNPITFKFVNFQQQDLFNYPDSLEQLKNSKDISELLFNCAKIHNINISKYHLNHFDSKSYCDAGQNYIIIDCGRCGKRDYFKLPCSSFFCEDCRKYLSARIKRHTKEYLWTCNHTFSVWTTPPEIKVTSWDKIAYTKLTYYRKDIIDKKTKQIRHKKGEIKYKNVYCSDLVYRAVELSLNQYCKKRKIKIGIILLPHSYGTENLNWFFHINALITSKALNQENKIIDFKPDFKELRELYRKNLSNIFKTPIYRTIQVKFTKKKGSYFISPKKAIGTVLDYFRHIPLKIKNIKVTNDSIIYQTSKSKQLNKKPNKVSHIEFYYLLLQHIPPPYFRTLRQVGLYSNHNKKRLKYPTSPDKKPKKELRCRVCKYPLRKENIIGLVHKNRVVWINPCRESILDCKDFEYQKESIIEQNGRLLEALPPPDDFIPHFKPKFFDENDDEDNENYDDYDEEGNFKPSNKFKSNIHIPMFEFKERPTKQDLIRKRFNRILDSKDKKLKLYPDDLMDLIIKGVC